MKTIDKQQKATRGKRTLISKNYIAGFFDGEGSIFITKINNKKSGNVWYRLSVSCCNSDPRPIYELHDRYSLKRKILTYIPPKKDTYKPSYQWIATGNLALKFLKKISPLLIVKKEQALLGMEFQEWRNKIKSKGKKLPQEQIDKIEEYRNKIHLLNFKKYLQPQRLSEKTPKGEATV